MTTSKEERQMVLALREVNQLSYLQIAKLLGLPLGTVRSRIWRARNEKYGAEREKYGR